MNKTISKIDFDTLSIVASSARDESSLMAGFPDINKQCSELSKRRPRDPKTIDSIKRLVKLELLDVQWYQGDNAPPDIDPVVGAKFCLSGDLLERWISLVEPHVPNICTEEDEIVKGILFELYGISVEESSVVIKK